MKVAVLGAGAIGSTFGGLLKHGQPETDVLLLARGEHGETMRARGGLRLEDRGGEVEVPVAVSSQPSDLVGSDLVLVCVKSQATEEAIRSAAPYLEGATILSLQNGVNQRVLGSFVPPDRLLLAMTTVNAAIFEPGKVAIQRPGPTMVGSLGDVAAPRVDPTVELLRKTGMKVEATDNILGAQYNKIALNTVGYASVLSASNFIPEAVLYGPWRRTVGLPLLRESLAVLDRAGIMLARTPGISDVFRFWRLLRFLELPGAGAMAGAIGKLAMRGKPIVFSLQFDLQRGKPTEIDFVNGEIVRLAREHDTPAPYNELVVQLVHELQHRPEGPFFTRAEVISRFQQIRA